MALQIVQDRKDLLDEAQHKLLYENAKALYDLHRLKESVKTLEAETFEVETQV